MIKTSDGVEVVITGGNGGAGETLVYSMNSRNGWSSLGPVPSPVSVTIGASRTMALSGKPLYLCYHVRPEKKIAFR